MRLTDFPITLFQRAGSQFWYARFTPKGGTQTKIGLATADVDAAKRKATEAYLEAGIRIKTGLHSTVRTFAKVADDYLRAQPKDAGEVIRYFKAFWSEKAIDAIDDTEYQKFLHWRRNYWVSGPGKSVAFIHYRRGDKSVRRPVVRKIPSASRLRLGLVASLARPDGNATGINILSGELVAKRLELLRELLPGQLALPCLSIPSMRQIPLPH